MKLPATMMALFCGTVKMEKSSVASAGCAAGETCASTSFFSWSDGCACSLCSWRDVVGSSWLLEDWSSLRSRPSGGLGRAALTDCLDGLSSSDMFGLASLQTGWKVGQRRQKCSRKQTRDRSVLVSARDAYQRAKRTEVMVESDARNRPRSPMSQKQKDWERRRMEIRKEGITTSSVLYLFLPANVVGVVGCGMSRQNRHAAFTSVKIEDVLISEPTSLHPRHLSHATWS